jgi:hypothetical protein
MGFIYKNFFGFEMGQEVQSFLYTPEVSSSEK